MRARARFIRSCEHARQRYGATSVRIDTAAASAAW